MLLNLLYLIACSMNNRLAGMDYTNVPYNPADPGYYVAPQKARRWFKLGFPAVLMVIATWARFDDWILGLIVGVGFVVWRMPGWGDYFAAFHGRAPLPGSVEVKFIDDLAYAIVRNPKSASDYRLWGMVAMALRGLIFSLPLFMVLAFYLGKIEPMIIWPNMLAQGVIYWLGRFVPADRPPFQIPVIEKVMGLYLGSLIILSMGAL